MKLIGLLLLITQIFWAQNESVNIQNNYGVSGYDLVSYFDLKATKGSSKFVYEYEGIKYRFVSKENLDKFSGQPSKYLPQYGGWCAYAMATKGEKIKINPKTFEIRNAKLYLFYNAYFDNTFEDWLEEGPEQLILKADKNWKKFE